jgi:alkylated DNA nucleotide flippase Atl1
VTDARHEEIIEAIREIPEGFVRTYGDVSPGAPRLSARLLSTDQVPRGLPWWRVVRADGSLAVGRRQREHLLAEGVPFHGDRVDMAIARIPHDP